MDYLVRHLKREHLEKHPVWAVFDSPEDFEWILSWGEAGEQIAHEINQAFAADDYYYPVLQLDDHWDCLRCVQIRATITAADGTEFLGCISGTYAFCIEIFPEIESDDSPGLGLISLHWPDRFERTLDELREKTGLSLDPFFPLRYKTEFRDSKGMRIEGFFGYEQDVSDYLEQKHGVSLRIRDVVRVVSLNSDDRYIWGDDPVRKHPQIGDIGRIQNIYDPADHAAPIVVECIREDDTPFYGGPTVWLAEFAQDELKLAERKS
ncbi:MAG: hypothetical protein R3C02_18425 [Planctomycetaceae bacterium]